MLKEIFGFFKTNPTWSLAITIISTFTIWLYKEFKVMIASDYKKKIDLVQKKMDLYGKLEAAIANAITQNADPQAIRNLYISLGECSSHFGEDTRQIMLDFYKKGDTFLLVTLMEFIEVEFRKLNKEKLTFSMYDTSTDILDSINKLIRPLKPIAIIFFTIFAVLVFILALMQQNNIWDEIYLITFFFSSGFSVMILSATISLWIDNKLRRQSRFRWALDICMILSPSISLLDWRLSIISPLLQIIALILYVRTKNTKKFIVL